MMKKTLATLIAVSALSMTLPVAAQAAWWNSSSDKTEQKCEQQHNKHQQRKGQRDGAHGFRELNLTDVQKTKLREIRSEQHEVFQKKMDAVLTPEQRTIVAKRKAERAERMEQRKTKMSERAAAKATADAKAK